MTHLFQMQMIKYDPLQILTFFLQVLLRIKLREPKQKIFWRFLHDKQILEERKRKRQSSQRTQKVK